MGGPPTASQLGKLLCEEMGLLTLALSGPGHSTALKGRPSTVLPQAVGAFLNLGVELSKNGLVHLKAGEILKGKDDLSIS